MSLPPALGSCGGETCKCSSPLLLGPLQSVRVCVTRGSFPRVEAALAWLRRRRYLHLKPHRLHRRGAHFSTVENRYFWGFPRPESRLSTEVSSMLGWWLNRLKKCKNSPRSPLCGRPYFVPTPAVWLFVFRYSDFCIPARVVPPRNHVGEHRNTVYAGARNELDSVEWIMFKVEEGRHFLGGDVMQWRVLVLNYLI